METVDCNVLQRYLKVYLSVLQPLMKHRALKGYRNMRFLRYVHRQKAIDEICEFVAPTRLTKAKGAAGKIVVGFEDWTGGHKSPISRRTCGPLQEIKMRLASSDHVILSTRSIDKFKTSVTCNKCHCTLSNMKAVGVHKKWDGTKMVEIMKVARVHKILHCQSSKIGLNGRCGATWDRDVNASRNILMLTLCEVLGEKRPPAFCHSMSSNTIKQTAATQHPTNTAARTAEPSEASRMIHPKVWPMTVLSYMASRRKRPSEVKGNTRSKWCTPRCPRIKWV
jgi:hypothetical protein